MGEGAWTDYQRCRTCGRWHPIAGAFAGSFCSRECASAYKRCQVCGAYYESTGAADEVFCSAECLGVGTAADRSRRADSSATPAIESED